ncbi:hypothetical protein [Alkalihalophilus pseudofirmus]|uniref:hypothetical protein n=1 Tax=Alkalihalophilus pseudofirmus TaxID=79885 RepID=UPI001C378A9D
MADKDIQIKIQNSEGGYDNLYPKTKQELVEGLETSLSQKVDKEAGKGLSSNDYTSAEKTKLSGIASNANNYTHPSTHPASMITESTTRRFTSDNEKETWNGKEDANKKGQANGYAALDSNAKVPLSQLPDASKSQTFVVTSSTERNALTAMLEGDKAFETSTGDSYIYDGSSWRVLAKADWENVSLDWGNIQNKPSSSIATIDDAVTKRHEHSNQSILNKLTDTSGKSSHDLGQFVTQSELGDAGYGDMTKATYDSNNNGKVDVAESAESVPWSGVTGKPSTFSPSTHTHPASQITESSTKRFVTDAEKALWDGKAKVVISPQQPTGADLWFEEV